MSYSLPIGHSVSAVPDAQTLNFTYLTQALQTKKWQPRLVIPESGLITQITGSSQLPAILGSNENVYLGATLYKNDSSILNIEVCADLDFSTSTVPWHGAGCIMDPPELVVEAGEYLEMWFIFPTFATNPNQIISQGSVIIDTTMCGTVENPCYVTAASTTALTSIDSNFMVIIGLVCAVVLSLDFVRRVLARKSSHSFA